MRAAALAGHDPRVLAHAQEEAKELAAIKARSELQQLSRLADWALEGAYGEDAAAAVSAALLGGRTPETLGKVGRIVSEARARSRKAR